MNTPPWNRTSRRTRVIKNIENYSHLIKKLSVQYGYPTYFEELVIYIDEPRVRIVLTKSELLCRWTEDSNWDEYHSLRRSLHLTPDGLKEKLWFLTSQFGNKGKISTAKVYLFPTSKGLPRVELRPETLIGPILTLGMPVDADGTTNTDIFDDVFNGVSEHLLPKDTLIERSRVKNETLPDDEILRHGISYEPILNEKIQDFCRRNGVLNTTNRFNTYKKLLLAKDNDYSAYEQMFEVLTDKKLLDVDQHAQLQNNAPSVSVIIPCFNTNETIHRVLTAIASQILPEGVINQIEVILVDDCSHEPVSETLSDSNYPFKIEVLRLENNHGVSNARMLGVTHASGEVLIFLDSDVLPSKYYFSDHIIRNQLISDAVFVSFKQNIDPNNLSVKQDNIEKGLERPNYQRDLRIQKTVTPSSVGNYTVNKTETVNILEDTGFFKAFPGSRNFGVYDLSTMVIGHNFTLRRESVLKASPFSKDFQGWGMEDVYLGLRVILNGCYVIPVLSSGVYHLDHPPRSGSEEQKRKEYERNTAMIEDIMERIFD